MPIDDDALGELLDELEIGLELNTAGPVIEPLLNALIGAAPQAALRQAAADAVEALWDADLEQEVRTELEGFREHAEQENTRLVPTIDSALAQLRAPAQQNHIAHALVWRAATKLIRRASRNHERMAELERALEHTPQATSAPDAADRRSGEPGGRRRRRGSRQGGRRVRVQRVREPPAIAQATRPGDRAPGTFAGH